MPDSASRPKPDEATEEDLRPSREAPDAPATNAPVEPDDDDPDLPQPAGPGVS